jgi:uncharacterized protein (TIRG00374 family)
MKKVLKIIIGLFITAAAIYFFLRNSDLQKIGAALKRIDVFTVLLAFFLAIFSLFLRGLRWGFLLPDVPGATKQGLFQLATISFMVNNVLPARLGEAARVYLLYKRNRYSVHVSLGSLFLERVLDTFTYSLFILLPGLVYYGVLSGKKMLGQIDALYPLRFAGILSGSILCLGVLFILFPGPLFKMGEAVERKLWKPMGRGVHHLLRLLKESTAWMFSLKQLIIVILLTPCVVICYTCILLAISRSLGLDINLLKALFVSGILAFGVAVPSSPGYVGTLHLACMEGLILFGVGVNEAAAAAILYHLLSWSITVTCGLVFYFQMNISLKDIKQAEGLEKGKKNIL